MPNELFMIHKVAYADSIFLIYERWSDPQALESHNRGFSLSDFRRSWPELICGDPDVCMLDCIDQEYV
jgi:quinol monooxygenase YgiN